MENELYHHGIKGMKWGIRRFQNKDGSLTKAGKKRYDDEDDSDKAKKAKTANSWRTKNAKDLSDDELNTAIKRLELEQRYNNLNPKTVSKGRQYVTDMFEKGVLPAVTNAGRKLIEEAITKAGEKALGLEKEQTKDALESLRKEAETVKLNREKMQNQDWIDRFKKSQADAKAEESAKKTAQEEAKKAAETSRDTGAKAAKQTKTSGKTETLTGEVEGEGKSRFTGWKSDNNSKTYDVDVSFTKSTVSEVKNSTTAAIGKSVTSALLESKALQLPGPSNTLEDKNNK